MALNAQRIVDQVVQKLNNSGQFTIEADNALSKYLQTLAEAIVSEIQQNAVVNTEVKITTDPVRDGAPAKGNGTGTGTVQ